MSSKSFQNASKLNVGTLQQFSNIPLVVTVNQFGAVGDGVTDDTTGIQNALNYVASQSGGKVIIPSGIYKISATLNVSTQVEIVGDNNWTSVLRSTLLNAPILKFENVSNCGARKLHLQYSGTPVSGANAISVISCQTCNFDNLWVSSSWNGIYIQSGGNHSIINYRCYSYENTALLLSGVIDINLTNFRFNAGNSTRGALGGIRLQGPVEAFTASQGDITLGVYGMTTADFGSNARGAAPYFNRFSQVYFDSPISNAARLESACHTDFIGCWFASSGHNEAVGYGSALDVPGIFLDKCLHLNFSGGDIYNNGGAGVQMYPSSKYINFSSGLRFKRNCFSRPSNGDAIQVITNTSDFSVQNCVFERDVDTALYKQFYAVNVLNGTSDRYFIKDNLLGGCSILDNGTGTDKSVTSNF